jgi:ABC-type transport system substrate-binding protein
MPARLRGSRCMPAALVTAALIACTAQVGGDGPAATPRPRPSPGGALRFGLVGAPATLDPYARVASDLTRALARPLYPSLYRFSLGGAVEPELARALETAPTGSVVHLHRVRWSDGKLITARDVVASARRATAPSGFAAFDEVEALDPRTVRFSGTVGSVPRALATAAFVLPHGRVGAQRVSGGPFRLAAYRPGLEARYVPTPRFAGPRAPLDEVRVRFVEDVRTLLELLERGKLDAAAPLGTVNLDEIDLEDVSVEGRLGWEVVLMDFAGSDLERAERAAVASGLDRGLIEETFVRDDGRVTNTLAPAPGAAGADGPWRHGLGGARSPDSTVQIAAPEGDELLGLVQRAAYTQLRAAGLDPELVWVDSETFYGLWARAAPADVALRRVLGAPGFGPSSERIAVLSRFPLFHVETYAAYREGVHGVAPVPLVDGPLATMARWWVER